MENKGGHCEGDARTLKARQGKTGHGINMVWKEKDLTKY